LAKTNVVAAIKAELRDVEKRAEALRQALQVLGGRVVSGARTVGGDRNRRRRTMSAAQKKAVGLRMKKYWAARRKAEKG
jgi:hypothetical protein